jgi:UDP-glucuronate 4-epimerase
MAKYLITGVAGLIASRVAALLLHQGHHVVGIDSLNDAYDIRLKEWRLAQLRSGENALAFSFQRIDICDRPALQQLFRHECAGGDSIAAIINLAARAGVRYSVQNPWVYVDTNMTGTLNLLDLAREFRIGKFVLASTSSLYGASNPMPYREDAATDQPLSPYAASKKGAEAMCFSYHHLYGVDVSVVRYFTVYGPAGRPDMMVFRFVQWIDTDRPVTVYGDGSQSRDFTYVDDIARGTVAALRPLGYEIINLGSDGPVVLMDAIHIIEGTLGHKAQLEYRPAHAADVPATWADITKARHLLAWEPQVLFAEGITRTVAWYRANRAWASVISTD